MARHNGPGNGDDNASAIAVDSSGNVHVCGLSRGIDIGWDFITIKYNKAGKRLWFQRYNGPYNGADWARDVAVDGSGNVYVTGTSAGKKTGYDFATIKY